MFELLSGVVLGVVGVVMMTGASATLKTLQQRRNDRAERDRQRTQAAHDLAITNKKIQDGKSAFDRAVSQDRVSINRSEKALGSVVNHYLGVKRRHQELMRDPQITKAVENGWLVWNRDNRLEINPGKVSRESAEGQLYGEATAHINRDLSRLEEMLGNMELQIKSETGIKRKDLVDAHGRGALEHLKPQPQVPSLGNQIAELSAETQLPAVRLDAGKTAKRSLRDRLRGAFGGGHRGTDGQDSPGLRDAPTQPNQIPAPPAYSPMAPPPELRGQAPGQGAQPPAYPQQAHFPSPAPPPAIPPKPTYPPGQNSRPPSYPQQPSGPPGQGGPRPRNHPRQVQGGGHRPR